MENIIINLTSDPSGLQPGIDGLVQMQVVDKDLADQVKKTNDEFQKGNKVTSDTLKNAGNDLNKLSTSFKNLDKTIVGGAYGKTLKELQKQVSGVSDEFKQLALVVDFAKKKQTDFKPNTPEWNELQKQIEAAQVIMKAFADEEGKTDTKTESLRAQLRALKQDIAAALEKTGGKITPEIQEMIDKAGQLDDTMKDINKVVSNVGSDTRNLDGMISLVSGGIGAFSAFQGVIGLTNSQSKQFEQSLIKLNSAMALLQGLQQIQNVLLKESAATQLIVNAQKKLSIINTQLEAAAESKNIVVRNIAIVTQRALNAAIAANPGVILLATIAAIAGALLLFANSSKKAKVDLEDLNRAMEDSIRRGEEITQSFTETGKTELDNLQRVIDQRRAAGASETELLNLQLQAAQKRDELSKKPLSLAGDSPEDIKKKFEAFDKEVQGQQSDLITINSTIDDINRKISLGGTEAEIEALKKSRDMAQSQYSLIKTQYATNAKVVKDYYESANDLQTSQLELQKHLQDESLKSATGYADARVLLAKVGSREELNAQIAAIRTKEQEELANVNLSAGERARINAAADKQISDLRFEYEKKALVDAKLGIDARVLKSKEGSKEELDNKLQSLQLSQDIDLKDKEITDNKKLEIEARYQKQRQELVKAYNKKVAEDAINGRIAELSAQNAALALSTDASTNSQLLANKKQLIDEEAALEVISLTDSEKNEELRRLKIKAVYARALADKQQLERDKQKADIDTGLANSENLYDRLIAKQNLVLQNEKSTTKQRIAAQDEVFRYEQAKIDAEVLANQQAYDAKAISLEEYLRKKNDLATASDQVDLEREQAHQVQVNQVRELAQETAIQLMGFAFANAKKGYDAEEARVKQLFDSKKISEEEYNKQINAIHRKQDKDAKAQALFTMLINQGPTLLKGFQQGGFAGVAAAFTLFFSLLGSLQSAELPAYKEGEVGIDGPGTSTSDSILARISKGESVITATQTRKHEGALKAINEDRFQQYLVQYEMPKLYQNMTMPEMPEYVQNITNQPELDYEKLGDVFAQKLAENPQHILSFDENGFTYAVKKGSDLTTYVNKKLTT